MTRMLHIIQLPACQCPVETVSTNGYSKQSWLWLMHFQINWMRHLPRTQLLQQHRVRSSPNLLRRGSTTNLGSSSLSRKDNAQTHPKHFQTFSSDSDSDLRHSKKHKQSKKHKPKLGMFSKHASTIKKHQLWPHNHLDPHFVTHMPNSRISPGTNWQWERLPQFCKQNLTLKLWVGYVFLNNWLIGSFILATCIRSDNSIWQQFEPLKRKNLPGKVISN